MCRPILIACALFLMASQAKRGTGRPGATDFKRLQRAPDPGLAP